MIYCERVNNYVFQEEKCLGCIFYEEDEDSCFYPEWIPGLKSGRDLEKENE